MIVEAEWQERLTEEEKRRVQRLVESSSSSSLRYVVGIDPGWDNFSISFLDMHAGTAHSFNINLRMVIDEATGEWRVAKTTEVFNTYACTQLVSRFSEEIKRASILTIEKQRKRTFVLMAANIRMLVRLLVPSIFCIDAPAPKWRPAFGLSVSKEEMEAEYPGFSKLTKKTQEKKAYKKRKEKSIEFVDAALQVGIASNTFVKEDGKNHADAAEAALIGLFGFLHWRDFLDVSPNTFVEYKDWRPKEEEPVRSARFVFQEEFLAKHSLKRLIPENEGWVIAHENPKRIKSIREITKKRREDWQDSITKKTWWTTPGAWAMRGRGKTRRMRFVMQSGYYPSETPEEEDADEKRRRNGKWHPDDTSAPVQHARRFHVIELSDE